MYQYTVTNFVNNDVSSGAIVYASDHNTQGALLAAVINGNIDNNNLSASAAIDGSKIATDGVTDTQLDFPRWWQEIARTTLGVAGDTITVSSIPARKYLLVLFSATATGGTLDTNVKFNNDGAANYAFYQSAALGVGGANVSQTSIGFESGATDSGQASYGRMEILNITAKEKSFLHKSVSQDAAGGATVAAVLTNEGKWANTSAQINRIDWTNTGTGDFAIGSEVIVLGHD